MSELFVDLDSMSHDSVTVKSPVGELVLVANKDHLLHVGWLHRLSTADRRALLRFKSRNPVLTATKRQLSEYFQGKRQKFDLPLHPVGTQFQKEVWRALTKIPYGRTVSYADQASRVGRPKAVRAVGSANGKNPLAIVVPCHRVIAKNGSLGGFGGGLDAKATLLELESQAEKTNEKSRR